MITQPEGQTGTLASVSVRMRQKRLVPLGVGLAVLYAAALVLAVAAHTDKDGLALIATFGIIYGSAGKAACRTIGRMANRLERNEQRSFSDAAATTTSSTASTGEYLRRWRYRLWLLSSIVWLPLTFAWLALPRFLRPSIILVAFVVYVGLCGGLFQAARLQRRIRG